jgi:hypothetical protein
MTKDANDDDDDDDDDDSTCDGSGWLSLVPITLKMVIVEAKNKLAAGGDLIKFESNAHLLTIRLLSIKQNKLYFLTSHFRIELVFYLINYVFQVTNQRIHSFL